MRFFLSQGVVQTGAPLQKRLVVRAEADVKRLRAHDQILLLPAYARTRFKNY